MPAAPLLPAANCAYGKSSGWYKVAPQKACTELDMPAGQARAGERSGGMQGQAGSGVSEPYSTGGTSAGSACACQATRAARSHRAPLPPLGRPLGRCPQRLWAGSRPACNGTVKRPCCPPPPPGPRGDPQAPLAGPAPRPGRFPAGAARRAGRRRPPAAACAVWAREPRAHEWREMCGGQDSVLAWSNGPKHVGIDRRKMPPHLRRWGPRAGSPSKLPSAAASSRSSMQQKGSSRGAGPPSCPRCRPCCREAVAAKRGSWSDRRRSPGRNHKRAAAGGGGGEPAAPPAAAIVRRRERCLLVAGLLSMSTG